MGPRFAAFVCTLCLFFSALSLAQDNLVTSPVDPGALSTLSGHRPGWATAENDIGPVEADLKIEHVTILLNRSAQREKEYKQFLDDLQNPASPNYHHWLTPAELGRRFGPSHHDIQAVESWLSSKNLTILEVSKSRDRISFSGTATVLAAAFRTEMHYFNVAGEKRIAVTTEPQIPSALKPAVKGIAGLSTVVAHAQHAQIDVQPNGGGYLCGGVPCQVTFPADFATIYNIYPIASQYNGSGQSVAIVGRMFVCATDISNFNAAMSTSVSPTFIVPPGGNNPVSPACSQPSGLTQEQQADQGEATLDVTRAGSIAPGAALYLVASAYTGVGPDISIAASYIVNSKMPNGNYASVMSVSFGACEAQVTLADVQQWDSIFSQGAGEGISSFVASGDAGAAGCDAYNAPPPPTQVLSPNFICASSYVTCLGGTEFNDFANPSQYWQPQAVSYIPEGAWNEPLTSSATYQASATGGGVSQYIPTPSWQVGPGVPGAQGRYTPDIAFSASGHDGYFVCFLGNNACTTIPPSFAVFLGTSAAAPDMAGITALYDQKMAGPQGSLNPLLYSIGGSPSASSSIFNDVTVSSSGVLSCDVNTPSMCNNSTPSPGSLTGGLAGYLVGTGYDLATGWGSLNVANFINNGSILGIQTVTALTLSSSSALIGSSTPLILTATVSDLLSGNATPTGSVNFYNGTTLLGSGILSSGVATYSYNVSSLAAGTDTLTASYSPAPGFAQSSSSAQTFSVQDFQVPSSTSAAINISAPGQPGSATLSFTPVGGFNQAVSLSCTSSTLPSEATCSFNPPTLSWTGGSASSVMTVQTTPPSSRLESRSSSTFYALWLPGIFGVLMFGVTSRKTTMKASRWIALALILSGSAVWMSACGGSSNNVVHNPGTPTGTYIVGVTASAGTLSHTFNVQVSVQ